MILESQNLDFFCHFFSLVRTHLGSFSEGGNLQNGTGREFTEWNSLLQGGVFKSQPADWDFSTGGYPETEIGLNLDTGGGGYRKGGYPNTRTPAMVIVKTKPSHRLLSLFGFKQVVIYLKITPF